MLKFESKMNNKKVLIIVGILVLVTGSGAGIWWFRRKAPVEITSENEENPRGRMQNAESED